MSQRNGRLVSSATLAVFLFAILFIHFFHTEKGLRPDRACPACHLQTSSVATASGPAAILPLLLLVEVLSVGEYDFESPAVCLGRVSRAPPSA